MVPNVAGSSPVDRPMSHMEAILFSLTQGLCEFFPISSSFHLHLLEHFLKKGPPPSFFFLICHLGTTFSLIFFLRKDLLNLSFKKVQDLFIAISPLFLGYILYKIYIPKTFSLKILSIFLILSSFFLFFQKKEISSQRKKRDMLFIGIMQAFALLPGISRSGSTIFAAHVRSWKMEDAVKFSFLLAIPTMLGGSIIEGYHMIDTISTSSNFSIYLTGFLISFFTGLFTVRYIFSLTCYKKLIPFGIYCLILGMVTLIYL